MPMPTGGPWPPIAHAPAYDTFRANSAWYSGDPDRLSYAYTRYLGARPSAIRPSQYSGGVVGRLSRWFWGTPAGLAGSGQDARLHIPAAADLASVSADLLFSEPPTLTHDDPAVQERLDKLVETLHSQLLEASEASAALGGVYLRPVIDREISPDGAFLAAVHADGALPTWRWGHLVEVTFWTLLSDEDPARCLRLLEHHSPRRVEYALYEGNETELGRPVPLTEHPTSAALIAELDTGSGQDTGIDRLGVVYIPNMRPSRQWRGIQHLAPLGRSDYEGVTPMFDALDETWSSWMRDIRLGRGRIHVPSVYLTSNGPGQGAYFDAEREVYAQVNHLPGSNESMAITATQFEIRVQEHKDTAEAITAQILRTAGYSQQTFGEKGDISAVTATEIQAGERRSFITRDRKAQYWTTGLPDAVELLLAMEAAHWDNRPAPARPTIEFGDSVSESPEQLARTAQLMRAAEAASTDTLVRLLHRDWDEDQIKAEVALIRDETAPDVDPGARLTGLAGQGPDEDPDAPEGV